MGASGSPSRRSPLNGRADKVRAVLDGGFPGDQRGADPPGLRPCPPGCYYVKDSRASCVTQTENQWRSYRCCSSIFMDN